MATPFCTTPVTPAALALALALGHVLFDDALPAQGIEELTKLLMPDLDTSTVRARGRTSYELPAERRAEVFGTVVVTRLHSWQPPRPETSGDDVATRVSGALVGGRRQPH
jgi:hypothetical protein